MSAKDHAFIDKPRGYYVYLYRDTRGKVHYVGYGKASSRASSHLAGSHNQALNDFLQSERYNLEIAGPFENERVARAIETALISALKPDCNIVSGPSQ